MKCLVFLLSVTLVLADGEVALKQFINANNLFSASLYKQILQSNNQNFLISPYSLETVLAFAQSGSKNETAQEIRNTLHLPDNNDQVESAVKESHSSLQENDRYKLYTANKMYVKEGFPIKETFKKAAAEVYKADIENVDFLQNEETAKTMNDWVEKQTNNRIKNLISPDVLDEYTRAILINAIYFKGNWSNRFHASITRKAEFFKTSNEVVQVDTMRHYGEWFNYYENSELNAKFLELPFEGGDVSMIIALPNGKEELASLEKQIDTVLTPQQLKSEFVNVALPKFKIESNLQLKDTLKNLGIISAFDERKADISGISGEKGDLYISDVLQKTYIDVEEDGVEAAAATYISFPVAISAPEPVELPEPKEFIADHPFIFYIKAKNIIIFAGRVVEPIH